MRRLRRLPMSCWGCGDAPRWGRAWSRSLPAQPKCASVSRETFVRFSIEARRDGIGRENPGGRRRSRARRRYGSARHVDRRGMFPWFHVQQKRAFGTPRCSSAFCSLKLCSKTPGRVSSSLGNAAFGLGSAVSGRVRRAKTSFLLHIAHGFTTRGGGRKLLGGKRLGGKPLGRRALFSDRTVQAICWKAQPRRTNSGRSRVSPRRRGSMPARSNNCGSRAMTAAPCGPRPAK